MSFTNAVLIGRYVCILWGVTVILGCSKEQPDPSKPLQETITDDRAIKVPTTKQSIVDRLIETPDSTEALERLAEFQLQDREYSNAAGTFQKLLMLQPEKRDTYEAQAANCLYFAGDYLSAISQYRELVERVPSSTLFRRQFAYFLNSRGYRFEANEQLRKLAQLCPLNFDELRALSFPDSNWIDVAEKPDINDQKMILSLGPLNAANALRIGGDVDEAITLLRGTSMERGDEAWSLYLRVLADSQRFELLSETLGELGTQQATQTSINATPAFYLAVGHLALHRKDKTAIKFFAQAIAQEPGSEDAHHALIFALKFFGEEKLAAVMQTKLKQVRLVQTFVRSTVSGRMPVEQMLPLLVETLQSQGRIQEALAWSEWYRNGGSPSNQDESHFRNQKVILANRYPSGCDLGKLLPSVKPSTHAELNAWLAKHSSANGPRALAIDDAVQTLSLPPAKTAVFLDVANDAGLHFRYQNATPQVTREFQIFQSLGGGVACCDYDCDGLVDIYFAQASGVPPHADGTDSNELLRNVGGQFIDITLEAGLSEYGYTMGVSFGDFNQDGFADIVVGNVGKNKLFINQGDGSFELSDRVHWDDVRFTTSVAIADLTDDHLPDIIEVNYLNDEAAFLPIRRDEKGQALMLPGPLQFAPAVSRIYPTLTDGTSSFNEQTNPWRAKASTGLGLLVTDLDGKDGTDVFIANDLRPNHWWVRKSIESSSAKWDDVAIQRGVALGAGGEPMACMGIACADFDQNGRADLHITNFENQWSNQYMQGEDGLFQDKAVAFGIGASSFKMLGFGTQAIDYDNNGLCDLVVGNGHLEDFRDQGRPFGMPTQILTNTGAGFIDNPVGGGDEYWTQDHWSRGVAKCDWNRDGLIDVVISDLLRPASLLENQTQSDFHWIKLRLIGVRSERDAIGARVTVKTQGHTFNQWVQTGDGYFSKNEPLLHLGLGTAATVDELQIDWPSGLSQTLTDLRVDATYVVTEADDLAWEDIWDAGSSDVRN